MKTLDNTLDRLLSFVDSLPRIQDQVASKFIKEGAALDLGSVVSSMVQMVVRKYVAILKYLPSIYATDGQQMRTRR